MGDHVKSSRQIQQDEHWRFGSCSCQSQASVTESRAVSVEWPLLKPDLLLPRRLSCERNIECKS